MLTRTSITHMKMFYYASLLCIVISNKFSKINFNITMIVYFALVIANCCYEIGIPAFMMIMTFYDLSLRKEIFLLAITNDPY